MPADAAGLMGAIGSLRELLKIGAATSPVPDGTTPPTTRTSTVPPPALKP
jgi:hypothetical protein